jgi:hypothetical protein
MQHIVKFFLGYSLPLVCIYIIFLASCQKDVSKEVIKTNDAMNTNVSTGSPIVYTDINPDQKLTCTPSSGRWNFCSNSYPLDLDNDGIIDYLITYSYEYKFMGMEGQRETKKYVIIKCNNQNTVAVDSVYPLAMNANNIISPGLNWKSDSTRILNVYSQTCSLGCFTSYSGNWFSIIDKFLGLQFKKGGKIFYGWVRLDVSVSLTPSSTNSFTVKDYAYNSTPGQPILAGQTK